MDGIFSSQELYHIFNFNPINESADFLLNLVSKVNINHIRNVNIKKRAPVQYRPWYFGACGGGVTIWPTILYTENYFTTSGECHRGDNIYRWLDIYSHEVRHIPQYFESGGMVAYFWRFIKEYGETQSHDNAPSEIEAEVGSVNFNIFYDWIVENKGTNALENLFINNIIQHSLIKNKIQSWFNECDCL